MEGNEATSLAKMAIAASLIVLVIGATLALWNLLYPTADEKVADLEYTVNMAVIDQISTLVDQSRISVDMPEKMPLVSTVSRTISEFDESTVLFVYYVVYDVDTGKYVDANLYTYANVVVDTSALIHPESLTTDSTHQSSSTPILNASRDLLKYSRYRCQVYSDLHPVSGNPNGMPSIQVVIVKE